MRKAGILLPVSSLPSPYGIGTFSKEAYEFVDLLKEAGQSCWQILPMGPTGYGDSPYQSFSAFAGNPYLIDLEQLIQDGLLTREECGQEDFGRDESRIDYGKLYSARPKILHKAFERWKSAYKDPDAIKECLEAELEEETREYCLYMAIKHHFGEKSWIQWDEDIRRRKPEAVKFYEQELEEEILFYEFQQTVFQKQWKALKEYAHSQGISIIGDIPIYAAFDSADAWAHPELFQFDENNLPSAVAGCPPDGFSADGQLWGNPLYRWDYQKATGYAWWMRRMAYCFQMYDVVRVDHFRGFDGYYSIPAGEQTAVHGHWEKGPGIALFQKMQEKFGNVNIIAEDLGFVTDSVQKLVKDTGFPSMKVLQFAFDSREESNYLPHCYPHNCVVYTGTHDNDTIRGWYESLKPADKQMAVRYMNSKRTPESEIHWDFIRLALASVADLAVIPLQDYLGLGSEARLNTPSTLGSNWTWRMKKDAFTPDIREKCRSMAQLYGRI